jgi:hypothetical protein
MFGRVVTEEDEANESTFDIANDDEKTTITE